MMTLVLTMMMALLLQKLTKMLVDVQLSPN